MSWTILETKNEYLRPSDTHKRKLAIVQCDCGVIETRRLDHVMSKRTTSCKSCASKKTAQIYPPPIGYKGIEGFSKTHYNSIKRGTDVRSLEWNVTQQDLWNLWIHQNGKCALSGISIVLEAKLINQTVDWKSITASLDRIDSSKGYTLDNIQWVHKELNFMKSDLNEDVFKEWCIKVAHHVNHEPNLSNDK